MNRIAAKAAVALACALALATPAASGLPTMAPAGRSAAALPGTTSPSPEAPPLKAASGSGEAAALPAGAPPPAIPDDGGTAPAATSPGLPPTDPADTATLAGPAAETTAAARAAVPAPAAPAAQTSQPTAPAGPPEPASIPPLSAPADAFAAPPYTARTEPGSAAKGLLTPQALVPDSNAAQVSAVFNAVNTYRASLGLPAVKYHATVAGMAQEWSDSIASREVIEHRANFWTDARALSPNNGAGEVIAVRWDRNAAQLVEWWKNSPAHNAILTDPRFNVVGIGITFTDGNWQTTPSRYSMWGVVNFFGYSAPPAGTTAAPGGSTSVPVQPTDVCEPLIRHMPPTLDLATAAIKGAGDIVSVDAWGQLINRPALGAGQFGPPDTIGTGFAAARQVLVTDWDRDGVFDVLAQWSDGRLTLYPGQLAGGFLPPVTLGQSGWAGMTLAVGGWCSTNRLPELLALDSDANLWLYPNRGAGDLVQRTLIASGVAATRLAMVDYDGDGFQDLLARQGDGNVLLYRGSGWPLPKAEARTPVASGWGDVAAVRALHGVTGTYSVGLVLQRTGVAGQTSPVQYWSLDAGVLSPPSDIPGTWAGQRLAQ
ncbi:CAP domain-containing protein [uncultured Arthrobacter sp.]|uniref:CAP domain-containing protein n=1 Tax=uncultured Arthrobacter sp. TaxID=114050 RepID=UPI0028D14936|nr:CAP domain-containing protein [uncultured Arthrobacter sp.]